jgi:hypothetical protein
LVIIPPDSILLGALLRGFIISKKSPKSKPDLPKLRAIASLCENMLLLGRAQS